MIHGSCHCGAVHWTYALPLESVTACNCTLCRRYGALWAYGYINEGVGVSGPVSGYVHTRGTSTYSFCTACGCIAYYLVNNPDKDGKRKIAVNLRMIADPAPILPLPIDHFDGFDTFDDLPRDGRTVRDLWF